MSGIPDIRFYSRGRSVWSGQARDWPDERVAVVRRKVNAKCRFC